MIALPPLAALRAFEAAARLSSFTQAAQELAMTQAAVSYQVKLLEQRLGVPLFARIGRSVQLTAAGRRLSAPVGEAFALLRSATAAAASAAQQQLNVTAAPTVAANWLAPRIGDFQMRHPVYAVRVDASVAEADLRVSEFDVAIRMGRGEWPGCSAQRLFASEYAPVCAPAIASEISSPADLAKVRLFGPPRWWKNWFAAAGVGKIEARPTDLATQNSEVTAAIAQGGAAIVNTCFFFADIRSGRLALPFPVTATSGLDYWLVHRTGAERHSNVADFTRWLLEQAETAN